MNKTWLLLASVAAGFLASCAAPVALGPTRVVGVAETQKLLSTGQAVPIDMRSPREYGSGHIPGAVLVPFGSAGTAKQVRKAMGGKQGVIYCRNGKRTGLALSELSAIPGVLHFKGGIIAWKTAGGPIEKGIDGAESGLERRPVYEEHRTEVYDFF